MGVGVGLGGVAVVEGGRGETWGGAEVVGLAEVGVAVGIGVTDLLDEHPAITTALTALIAIAVAATLIRSLSQPRMCRCGAPGAARQRHEVEA